MGTWKEFFSLHSSAVFTKSMLSFLQFLDKLYDLMVSNKEGLTLTVMLSAFNNIARLETSYS